MRRFLSFGAGVQSTALWLLIGLKREALEEEMGGVPEIALFADTGAEPVEIYEHIEQLQAVAARDSRFIRIEIVRKPGDSLEQLMLKKEGNRFNPIPAFTLNADGETGMLRRQCTREYKITPLNKAYRRLLGYQPRQRIPPNSAEVWLGISTDEAGRAKDSRDRWITNRFPLLELGMNRTDCANLLRENGIKPVKSRCCFCPYISDWQGFRERHPEAFERACRVDEAIRDSSKAGAKSPCFVHRSGRPLREALKWEQQTLWSPLWEDWGFEDECDGMCGL